MKRQTKIGFPKPGARKRKTNHSGRNKTRAKSRMVKDLDKWARREVVELRDQNICQFCSAVHGEWDSRLERYVVIQWCHFQTREYYITRWEPDNTFAGCDRCHKWFDNHKVVSYDAFAKKWPERYERVQRVLRGNCKTTDAWIRELWLEHCGPAVSA